MPRKHPEGHVFAVGHPPSPSPLTNAVPHPPNTFPISRTPEHAHKGTFWCSLSPSLISNTRTCPHGHILVLGHLPSLFPPSRTQERAHVGSFLCLGTSPPPSPVSLISNSKNTPCRACFCHPACPPPLLPPLLLFMIPPPPFLVSKTPN